MEGNIMVSVLCTAYNHEKFIKDAIEGVVSQKTNFKYELIIHDDASTDGTAKVIKEYENKDRVPAPPAGPNNLLSPPPQEACKPSCGDSCTCTEHRDFCIPWLILSLFCPAAYRKKCL